MRNVKNLTRKTLDQIKKATFQGAKRVSRCSIQVFFFHHTRSYANILVAVMEIKSNAHFTAIGLDFSKLFTLYSEPFTTNKSKEWNVADI